MSPPFPLSPLTPASERREPLRILMAETEATPTEFARRHYLCAGQDCAPSVIETRDAAPAVGRRRPTDSPAGGPPTLWCSPCGRAARAPLLRWRTSHPHTTAPPAGGPPRALPRCNAMYRHSSSCGQAGHTSLLRCGSSRSVCARLNHAVRNNLGTSTLCAIEHRPSYQSGPSAPGCNSRQRRARMGRIRSAAKPRRNKYPPNRR